MEELNLALAKGDKKTFENKKEEKKMKVKKISILISIITIVLVFSFISHAQSAPEIINPTPGSTLSGSTVTFSWLANGTAVTYWWLYVGSGTGKNDIHNSGLLTRRLSTTVSGLPTDGSQVYVRLWYWTGKWNPVDAQYTAFSNNASSNADCPCFTTVELDSLYDKLLASQGKTVKDCWESDYSSSKGYPPYTYYYVEACEGPYPNCDFPQDIVAGVRASHPYIGGQKAYTAWNAECYVLEVDRSVNQTKRTFHSYDANLNHREVEACSKAFKNSKWAQDAVCQ